MSNETYGYAEEEEGRAEFARQMEEDALWEDDALFEETVCGVAHVGRMRDAAPDMYHLLQSLSSMFENGHFDNDDIAVGAGNLYAHWVELRHGIDLGAE